MTSDVAVETTEKFLAAGEARDVLDADQQAWAALSSCLGRDPVAAWKLITMTHLGKRVGLLGWSAEFQRDQSVPVPEPPEREVAS